MKAIILAAGMGTRLGKYGKGKPKCLLEFEGMTLLERQIMTLRTAGVADIVVVRGYEAEQILLKGIRTYDNREYASTNMVASLLCAREELEGEILICYGDILYEKRVIKALINAQCEVGVVVDTDFEEYWGARMENPDDDHESLVIQGETIVSLGESHPKKEERNGRYVGLIKCTASGTEKGIGTYEKQRAHAQPDARWYESPSFKKGYMTDLLQAMIDDGSIVTAVSIQRGWLEFDTAEDYERYLSWVKNGSMERFFRLS